MDAIASTTPTFMQGRPSGREWVFISGRRFDGHLTYQDSHTGELIAVPNIW